MRQVKAVLFDCDGVLIDSEPMGCRALADVISSYGRPMGQAEASRVFSGNSAEASKAWLRAQGLPAEAIFDAADARLFEIFEEDVPLIPGIEAVLTDFTLPTAVCSNSLIRRLERSIQRTPIAEYFAGHIYSAEQVSLPKPAADLAIFAAERLNVSLADSLFIDDNVQGIACGRAAGCITVGFIGPSEHRASHAATLHAAGADYVVEGMQAFHRLLRQLV